MNKSGILVIDDDAQLRRLLEITLQSQGYQVRMAANAKEGLLMAGMHPPDLVILDLGLPDRSGRDVLQGLRQWFTGPVIILSVQNNESTIVAALDHGANDYVTKPFRTGELLARIRSSLRVGHQDNSGKSRFGNLEVNLNGRSVWKNNQLVKLTSTEYNLLALLIKNEGKVLTHSYLLRAIWGPGYVGQSQYLRVFIAQLRKKLEDDPNRPVFIQTESGVGYRFTGNA